jgi:hypothetical protein
MVPLALSILPDATGFASDYSASPQFAEGIST